MLSNTAFSQISHSGQYWPLSNVFYDDELIAFDKRIKTDLNSKDNQGVFQNLTARCSINL